MVHVQTMTFKDNLVPFNFLGQSPRSSLVGSLLLFLCSQQFLYHRKIPFCTGLWPLLWVLFLLIPKLYSDLGISHLHMYFFPQDLDGLWQSHTSIPVTQLLLLATHYPVFGSLASFSCPTALGTALCSSLPANPGLSTASIPAAKHHLAGVFTVHSIHSLCYFCKPCRSSMFSHQKGSFSAWCILVHVHT